MPHPQPIRPSSLRRIGARFRNARLRSSLEAMVFFGRHRQKPLVSCLHYQPNDAGDSTPTGQHPLDPAESSNLQCSSNSSRSRSFASSDRSYCGGNAGPIGLPSTSIVALLMAVHPISWTLSGIRICDATSAATESRCKLQVLGIRWLSVAVRCCSIASFPPPGAPGLAACAHPEAGSGSPSPWHRPPGQV